MRPASRFFVAGAAATVALTVLAGCGTPAEVDTGPTSIIIGVAASEIAPTGDPLAGTYLYVLGRQASYESLIVWDADAKGYAPWLAEEYTLSEDRKTMTLKLHENVDFTDGTHMDAQAVEDYFDLLLASEGYVFYGDMVGVYGMDVTATDEYTIEITTTVAMGDRFLNQLDYTPIASPTALADHEALADAPVGTGPYLIDEVVPEVSMSFVRNPNYWNPDAFDFDEVTYLVFSDQVAALNALKSGQIDAANINSQLAVEAEAEGFALHQGGGTYAALFVSDVTGAIEPALADQRVRQAISLAFDRETIRDTIDQGLGVVSSQPFTEGQAEYVEGGDDRYAYDLDLAKDLMAEAGYADGFDVVIPGAPASVGSYPTDYVPIVLQALAEIGITAEIEPIGADEWYGALGSDEYALLLVAPAYANTVDIMAPPALFFGSSFADDATFIELVTTRDGGSLEESTEAAAELGEYMLDQAWYGVVAHTPNVWASIPEIDVQLGAIDSVPRLFWFSLAED